jgi:hypothetical protein
VKQSVGGEGQVCVQVFFQSSCVMVMGRCVQPAPPLGDFAKPAAAAAAAAAPTPAPVVAGASAEEVAALKRHIKELDARVAKLEAMLKVRHVSERLGWVAPNSTLCCSVFVCSHKLF